MTWGAMMRAQWTVTDPVRLLCTGRHVDFVWDGQAVHVVWLYDGNPRTTDANMPPLQPNKPSVCQCALPLLLYRVMHGRRRWTDWLVNEHVVVGEHWVDKYDPRQNRHIETRYDVDDKVLCAGTCTDST